MSGRVLLSENFDEPGLNPCMTWYNSPRRWRIDSNRHELMVEPEPETEVLYSFVHRYDQAGLMIRMSPEEWIKATAEYEPGGESLLGVVVTRDGYSDWSTQAFEEENAALGLRIVREKAGWMIYGRFGGGDRWSQLRMAHLGENRSVQCGLSACCPQKDGFAARFRYFTVTGREGG